MKAVKVNGWKGHLTVAAGVVLTLALGVGVTFTWRVFDSLLAVAEIRRDVIQLQNEVKASEARLSKQIEATMQDRCFGQTCDDLDERLDKMEARHQGRDH